MRDRFCVFYIRQTTVQELKNQSNSQRGKVNHVQWGQPACTAGVLCLPHPSVAMATPVGKHHEQPPLLCVRQPNTNMTKPVTNRHLEHIINIGASPFSLSPLPLGFLFKLMLCVTAFVHRWIKGYLLIYLHTQSLYCDTVRFRKSFLPYCLNNF